MKARLTLYSLAVAAATCGCSDGHSAHSSPPPVTSALPAAHTTVAKVSTSITQRGVTVSIIRVVLHTDGPPENVRRLRQPFEWADAGAESTADRGAAGRPPDRWSGSVPGARAGRIRTRLVGDVAGVPTGSPVHIDRNGNHPRERIAAPQEAESAAVPIRVRRRPDELILRASASVHPSREFDRLSR